MARFVRDAHERTLGARRAEIQHVNEWRSSEHCERVWCNMSDYAKAKEAMEQALNDQCRRQGLTILSVVVFDERTAEALTMKQVEGSKLCMFVVFAWNEEAKKWQIVSLFEADRAKVG
jgi:hypothetical protein